MDDAIGLTSSEAKLRLARDGANELAVARQRGPLVLLREVVSEPMFLLLVACGITYMTLGDAGEAAMLLCFVLVVVVITYVQRQRSERSLDALRDLASPRALVLRDGVPKRIAGREVVAGDVVLLAEGDRVPADLLLVEAADVAIDESLLTGEALPVAKHAAAVDLPGAEADASHGTTPQDETAQAHAYAGTLVTRGIARGRVLATGAQSALGRIGASLHGIRSERTRVQRETERIVRWVAGGGLLLAAALALAYGLTRGDWLHGLLAGLTLAMAIIPEELPVVLTIFLGLGAWRLARANVLTRSMPAVELLGATTVLCVDKTGTLTMNRMSVRALSVDGSACDLADGRTHVDARYHALLEHAVLASRAQAFDPMEAAIGDAGRRLLTDVQEAQIPWTLVEDYPLTRELLAMSRVWCAPGQPAWRVAAKGAPEAILELCRASASDILRVTADVETMAQAGLRVLAVARASLPPDIHPVSQRDIEYTLLGLIGLEDPLRPDVPQAIADCQAAGIRVVMITGDHPQTALSIAQQAGIVTQGRYLAGPQLAELDDAALALHLADTRVFCRVRPEQKLRLVQAFRARGDVVAMTGDGVNDAPALKAANIGVAMGARGTDVAREAASLVLLNDDFASLVTAVRHGRRVFANLTKAMTFVLAVHVPIIGLSILPVLLGWPLLLMPVHILFLQLVIDPACSIVFEAEPIEADAMQQPPRATAARLFSSTVLLRGMAHGSGLLALVAWTYVHALGTSASEPTARAAAYAVLVLSNLALIHVTRHGEARDRQVNPAFAWITLGTLILLLLVNTVPAVRGVFKFGPLSEHLLLVCAAATVGAWVWFEIVKRVTRAAAPRATLPAVLPG